MRLSAVLLLFIFCQCSSSSRLGSQVINDDSASYMRYIPGAGGGKGILFKVSLKKSPADLKIDRFVVNDIEVPATLEDSVITASVFYTAPPPTRDNPNPEPVDAVLFNQENFHAIIYLSVDGKTDSIHIKNFREEEQPLYQ